LLRSAIHGDPYVVLNEVGARQGCAYGSAIYSMVQHPVLIEVANEFADVEIAAFADDAWFLGPAASCAAAQARYSYLYSLRLCGELNDAKSVAFSHGLTHADALNAGLSAAIPWAVTELADGTVASGGVKVVGAPIGTDDFVAAFLEAAVNDATEGLRRLSHMPKRQHRLALVQQSFAKRLNHIQRLVPTNAPHLTGHLRQYDDRLAAAAADLVIDRGVFHEQARVLTFLPAGLGGLGIESSLARADAAYLSSYLSATTRLEAIHGGPANLHGGAATVALGQAASARQRLVAAHPRVDQLLGRISMADAPRRVQSKIMNLVHADDYDSFFAKLSPRDAATVAQAAANPYVVTIVPNGDPSLDLSNAQLATTIARRLCIPQPISTSSIDAADQTFVCPACQRRHANGHLDQALICFRHGGVGRTRWHNSIQHEVGAFTNSVGHHNRFEPSGVDPNSGKRADGECNSLKAGGNSVFWDVETYVVSTGDSETDAVEATFPGLKADNHEWKKTRKHAGYINAGRVGDEFVPLVVSEVGSFGPQALAFFGRLARATECPAQTLQYRLRRLAVVTAREVHNIMHGGVRLSMAGGRAGPRPAEAPPDAGLGAGGGDDDEEEDGPRENEPLEAVEQAVLAGTRDVGDGAADGGLPAMAAGDETAGAAGVGGGVTGAVTGDDADDRRGGAGFPTALA